MKQQQANTPLKNQQHQPLLPLKKQFLFTQKKNHPKNPNNPNNQFQAIPAFLSEAEEPRPKSTARNPTQPAETKSTAENRILRIPNTTAIIRKKAERMTQTLGLRMDGVFFVFFLGQLFGMQLGSLAFNIFLLRLLDLRVKVLSASVLHIDLHAFLVFFSNLTSSNQQ